MRREVAFTKRLGATESAERLPAMAEVRDMASWRAPWQSGQPSTATATFSKCRCPRSRKPVGATATEQGALSSSRAAVEPTATRPTGP